MWRQITHSLQPQMAVDGIYHGLNLHVRSLHLRRWRKVQRARQIGDNCKGSRLYLYVLFKNISIGDDIVITSCGVCNSILLRMTDLILAFLTYVAASLLSDLIGPYSPQQ